MKAEVWAEEPLGALTEKIGSGATPRGGKDAYKEEGIALIRSMNIHDLRFDEKDLAYIDVEQAGKLDNVVVEEGDVLLNITGASVARCALAPSAVLPARVNQHVAILRPDKSRLDGKFLAYLLVSPTYKARLLSQAQGGATREALTKGGLETFSVSVPPLLIQRRIASVLSAYDDLIENNTRRITLLEEMARRLYEEWFVKFRFPGHEEVSFDGGLPEGWARLPVKELYEGLFDGPHATPPPSDDGPVFLGIKNIREDGGLDLASVRHIAESDFPRWTKRVTPQEGDIVFSYEATLNRYALIPKGFRGCLGRRLALVRPKQGCRFYLYHHFFSHDWRQVINENKLAGATVERVPLMGFPGFPINLPPASVLAQFDDLVTPTQKLIELLREKNINLRAQRDLLLPKLVSGQIDVSKIELPDEEDQAA